MNSCVVITWLSRLLAVLALLLTTGAGAEPVAVQVAGPYVELRTGPGHGYPAFHAVERGRELLLLGRRNDWFQLRTDRDVTGWLHRDALRESLEASGLGALAEPLPEGKFSLGMSAGSFESDAVVELMGSYLVRPNWALEGSVAQVAGTFSNSWIYGLGVRYRFRPEQRLVPTLSAGLVWLDNAPRSTVLGAGDYEGWGTSLGAGLTYRLKRGLALRAELKQLRARFDEGDENFFSATAGFAFRF